MDQVGLADRLKDFRFSLKLSQKALAGKVSVSPTTYNAWEKGRTWPGAQGLLALCELGCNINWLLTGEGMMGLGEGTASNDSDDEEVDYVLMEAAEQLREAGLAKDLLLGRRGRLDLRWRLVKTLFDANKPLPMEELLGLLLAKGNGSVDKFDWVAEIELGENAGIFKRSEEGYQVVDGAIVRNHSPEDIEWSLRTVLLGLGQDIVPAMKRQDGTGGLVISEVVVEDSKEFIQNFWASTKSFVKSCSSEEGDRVFLYLGIGIRNHS